MTGGSAPSARDTGTPAQGRRVPGGGATPAVSVVVVSRGRGGNLALCLQGLARLHYPNYEIVVVADPEGMAALRDSGLEPEIKTVAYAEPNIAVARNRGVALAAGEIVAFVDDDAVPEPTWLSELVRGFAWPEAAAAGGFVRGRNGISWQWRARSVDRTGEAAAIDLDGDAPVLLTPNPARAIKTEGTNMAVRRSILAGMGGFDPGYRFFLDETDLNVRLAAAGHPTALVPTAEVHHAYAASRNRAGNRAPLDLFEVGASTAYFLRRHAPGADHGAVLSRTIDQRRRDLLAHMVDGRLEPGDVRRLLRRLSEGIADGLARPFVPLPPIPHSPQWFLPFQTRATGEAEVLAGRLIHRRRHRAAAIAAAAQGRTVTLFLYSRTALAHRVRFRPEGYWEHRGGLWGRSDRDGALVRVTSFGHRVREETERIARQRGL